MRRGGIDGCQSGSEKGARQHKVLDTGHHTRINQGHHFPWVPEVRQSSKSSGEALVTKHKGNQRGSNEQSVPISLAGHSGIMRRVLDGVVGERAWHCLVSATFFGSDPHAIAIFNTSVKE